VVDSGVCGGRGDAGEEEGFDRDWAYSERAGGDGRVHTVDEGICDRGAGGVCGGEGAVVGGEVEAVASGQWRVGREKQNRIR